jgi:adenosine kinase
MSKHLILGMGNPLLDFSAVVKPEFLTKYNLKSNDAILYDKEDIFEELKADYEVEYIAGKILCLTIFT